MRVAGTVSTGELADPGRLAGEGPAAGAAAGAAAVEDTGAGGCTEGQASFSVPNYDVLKRSGSIFDRSCT